MRSLAFVFAAALALVAFAPDASAHTVSIGTHNAGAPGSVRIWMGSYHSAGSSLEGSIAIDGGTPVAFSVGGSKTGTKPAQLIDGTNNFFAPASGGAQGQFTEATNNTLTVNLWQGVTFTGLSAGFHTYQITGMNSAVFADWNSGRNNWTGRIFIPGSSTQTPEPASMLLLGAGLAGIAAVRRRRRRNA